MARSVPRQPRRAGVVLAAGGGGGKDEQKPSFGDELLDFMCECCIGLRGAVVQPGNQCAALCALARLDQPHGRCIAAPTKWRHRARAPNPPCRADAGKKLRKWYGQEGQVLPRDGNAPPEGEQRLGGGGEEEAEEQGPREYVAVLDADSTPMAEQVRW